MWVNVYGKIFLVRSMAASDWLPNSQTELKFVWKSKHAYIHSYMSVRRVYALADRTLKDSQC